jgi:putative SOS response-associated peptidase YedK
MCGRFAFQITSEELAKYFDLASDVEAPARFNIAPSQPAPVVRLSREGQPKFSEIRWGLIPFWAKDKALGARMINARAETLAQKPAYRAPFRRRRCLVLASGFYEWQATASGKVPNYFSHDDGMPLGFAGLWDRWQDAAGQTIDSCTVVTVPAEGVVKPIHHRMPLILETRQHRGWMDRDTATTKLEEWLQNVPAPPLQCWPVALKVNDPRNDGPELIEPSG